MIQNPKALKICGWISEWIFGKIHVTRSRIGCLTRDGSLRIAMKRIVFTLSLFVVSTVSLRAVTPQESAAIQGFLSEHCIRCHWPEKQAIDVAEVAADDHGVDEVVEVYGEADLALAVRTISVVRNVKASGPLVFVNDANSQGAHFAKTIAMLTAQGKPHVEKWDTNPMAGALAPKNGWVHPFVIYRSDFGGKKHAYSLLNVDVDKGVVKQRVELAEFE